MKKTTISKFEKINGNSIINKGEVRFYKNTNTKEFRQPKRSHLFDNLEVELAIARRMRWLDITK
ncbi:MAG TPA: hypothetical protein EYP92_08920 [Candidatus Thioglobus sp.]|jgi:uncharacterized membrane protein|nr:hypothetical protein [Candidatus Thioglobus sp.]HIK77423.1 hypothetical protein [Gammaproteobacteria bacterium]